MFDSKSITMNEEAFLIGFVKAAYEGASRLEMNQFAPIARRGLSEGEKQQINVAKQKPLRKIFTSTADPLTADMSSPAWAGGIGAGLGGLGGGAFGLMAGGEEHPLAGLLIGALAGGGLGGVIGYKGRQATNDSIEEAMRKLPEGATRDDYLRDPRIQAEMEREN
ncbi:hypothetical protein EKK58_00005, partial [Candidatus Dependentiae bacterium]